MRWTRILLIATMGVVTVALTSSLSQTLPADTWYQTEVANAANQALQRAEEAQRAFLGGFPDRWPPYGPMRLEDVVAYERLLEYSRPDKGYRREVTILLGEQEAWKEQFEIPSEFFDRRLWVPLQRCLIELRARMAKPTADLDSDGDVDQDDFAIMQRCRSGAGVPKKPGC